MATTVNRRVLVERSACIMATHVSVRLAATPGDEQEAARAADTCMGWFRAVDERLSRFRPESELSRMNGSGGRWFTASALLFGCVERAVTAAHASLGLFDPTLLPHLEALGYDRDFALLDTTPQPTLGSGRNDLAPILSATRRGEAGVSMDNRWREIELDAARQRIRLPRGVKVDLGGIAKGWAADVALERFRLRFPGALVNVGGDLRLRGGPQLGVPWSVGIRDPRRGREGDDGERAEHVAMLTFSRGGLATSGAVRRWWWRGGRRVHHLLDPRTRQPARLWIAGDETDVGGEARIATATALAPTAARAEVAAKAALLRGYPAALRAVEATWERYGALGTETDADSGVALLLVLGSGEIILSANLRAYLDTWGTDGAPLPLRVLTAADGGT
jgi:thiamine biosynthesis lipoprotein